MSDKRNKKDTPNLPIAPPLFYAAAMVLAALGDMLWHVDIFTKPLQIISGLSLLLLAGAIKTWGALAFKKAKTNIPTFLPATTIVDHGPYAYSRNPIYLGLNIMYLGAMILFDIPAGLLLFAPLVLIIHFHVIAREEAYLEGKFGKTYLAYKSRVRKWL